MIYPQRRVQDIRLGWTAYYCDDRRVGLIYPDGKTKAWLFLADGNFDWGHDCTIDEATTALDRCTLKWLAKKYQIKPINHRSAA